jgi:hypothetical protein
MSKFAETVKKSVGNRIDEAGEQANTELRRTGLQDSYISLFDKVMTVLPEEHHELLKKMDGIIVEMECFMRDRMYVSGLLDGIELGRGL